MTDIFNLCKLYAGINYFIMKDVMTLANHIEGLAKKMPVVRRGRAMPPKLYRNDIFRLSASQLFFQGLIRVSMHIWSN